MQEPQKKTTSRTRHFWYIQLYLFYNLAHKGGLFIQERKGKSVRVIVNQDHYQEYKNLSFTEQYISILQILWIHADWEVLHDPERGKSAAPAIQELFDKAAALNVPKKLIGDQLSRKEHLLAPFLEYLKYFGLWDFTYQEFREYIHNHKYAKSVTPTPLGIAMSKIFARERLIYEWNSFEKYRQFEYFSIVVKENQEPFGMTEEQEDEEIDELSNESFYQAFLELFPSGELTQTISLNISPFRKGNHLFKVSFKDAPDIWRRIAMPAKATIHHLHEVIHESIQFDDDGLYAFFPHNKAYGRFAIMCPWEGIKPFADEVLIGEFPVNIGQTFLYLFNYGDAWKFDVIIEEVDTESPLLLKPKIVAENGEAPAQYPNFEERYYEDW